MLASVAQWIACYIFMLDLSLHVQVRRDVHFLCVYICNYIGYSYIKAEIPIVCKAIMNDDYKCD